MPDDAAVVVAVSTSALAALMASVPCREENVVERRAAS